MAARRRSASQSGWSAVRPQTSNVLIVAEALHATAAVDVSRLVDDLAAELTALWSAPVTRAVLDAGAPGCEVPHDNGLTRQRRRTPNSCGRYGHLVRITAAGALTVGLSLHCPGSDDKYASSDLAYAVSGGRPTAQVSGGG
ncbi:hypothetical protein ACIBTV_03935 [Micromonospora sp. NPDC049366]|uniref:hypothetical protein n=1 Tax=Micromonospora sp. NPDC049366 TaxID=3364271 RepID=UPI0037BB68BE